MRSTSSVSHAARPEVSTALLAAEAACRARGVQFTQMRKLVLQILCGARQPLGAYDVLKRMEGALDRRLAPPSVYRALDFLLAQKLISKIESRNAFVPCAHPDHPHTCVFFICENCGASEEIEDHRLERLFQQKANSLGFRITKQVMEFEGLCANCRASTPLKCADTPHARQL